MIRRLPPARTPRRSWAGMPAAAGRRALGPAVGLCLCACAAAAELDPSAAQDAVRRRSALAAAQEAAAQEAQSGAGLRAERLRRVQEMRARGHLQAALAAARRLAHDYPGDAEIEALHGAILAERDRRSDGDAALRLDEVRQEMALRTEMDLIPLGGDGWPAFPADWRTRSAGRAQGRAGPAEPVWREALRDRLAERVSFDADGRTAVECLRLLAQRHGINVAVAPALAAAAGEPLRLRVPSIRLDHLIGWIARSLDSPWSLADGAVWVGPDDGAEVVLAVHDIAALVVRAPDQPLRTVALAAAGSAGESSAFAADHGDAAPPAFTVDEVVDLIRSAVSPGTWERPGCGIRIQGHLLYVSAPSEVHALVREFLRAQERQQNLQVRIEARWLQLDDRFVEEIGVDWNSALSPFGLASGQGAEVQNQRGRVAGTVSNVLPATAMAINPALAGTGLSLGAIVLDRIQAAAALTAVERTQKARILESLSVVTLNGVRANIFSGTQDSYVASYQIVNNNLDPEVKVLSGGMDLSVRPLVSADRRYVTLELRPSVSAIRYASETIRGERIITSDSGRIGFIASQTFEIGLPIVDLRTAGATAMIPDRGSLLVGGFANSLDQITNTRVPYLGSVPFLGRLFGRRGRYSQHDRLFLLANATIIAYDELETRL